MTKSKSLFESRTCPRCAGSGRYSYCTMHGSTCFKCNGRGWLLTKRGAAAQRMYTDMLSKPVSELKAGDVVRDDHYGWMNIESVKPCENGLIALELVGRRDPAFRVSHHAIPDNKMRVAHGVEFKQAAVAKCKAYQDTLTAAGTPRKVKGSVE